MHIASFVAEYFGGVLLGHIKSPRSNLVVAEFPGETHRISKSVFRASYVIQQLHMYSDTCLSTCEIAVEKGGKSNGNMLVTTGVNSDRELPTMILYHAASSA